MSEHTPHPFLLKAMTPVLLDGCRGAALLFWIGGVIWPGGLRGLMAALGPGAVALFGALHIPAAIHGGGGVAVAMAAPRPAAAQAGAAGGGAALYFGLAVLFGIFLNYLLVSAMGSVVNPAMPGG